MTEDSKPLGSDTNDLTHVGSGAGGALEPTSYLDLTRELAERVLDPR
jgi:hypothetical protein